MANLLLCSTSRCSSSFLVSVLVVLLSQVCSRLAVSHSTVKFLPGFHGPLPFHLETGYVGVGESEEDVQLFYYFLKSERNPKEDPLMLWLSGGPGCSAFSALAFEIDPLYIKVEEYNGSLHAYIGFQSRLMDQDLPANTGFSYTKYTLATQLSDSKQTHHGLQFLRKWLINHPEFLSNSIYIGGDSYSGIIVPRIALGILKGNEDGVEPSINFQVSSIIFLDLAANNTGFSDTKSPLQLTAQRLQTNPPWPSIECRDQLCLLNNPLADVQLFIIFELTPSHASSPLVFFSLSFFSSPCNKKIKKKIFPGCRKRMGMFMGWVLPTGTFHEYVESRNSSKFKITNTTQLQRICGSCMIPISFQHLKRRKANLAVVVGE